MPSQQGPARLREKQMKQLFKPPPAIAKESPQLEVASKILEESSIRRALLKNIVRPSKLEEAARISKKAAEKGVPMSVERAYGRLGEKARGLKLGLRRLGRAGKLLGVAGLPFQYAEFREAMKTPLYKKEEKQSVRSM